MEYFCTYHNNECSSTETKRTVWDAGFVDESGLAVPLPDELTKMFKPLECELCGVIVSSEVTAYTHYEGKVHMKNVNAFMKEQYNIFGSMKKPKVEFTPHQCEVCKCELLSLIQAQQHYSGKVHKKNLRKVNYDPLTSSTIQSSFVNDDLESDLLKDLLPPPPPPVLSDFICEICNISTNTEYQLIVHKNGTKHKKKIKKLKETNGNSGIDGFSYHNEAASNLTIPEPIITEYLPLSDEPLHFNNLCNNNFTASGNETSLSNEEPIPLCIKWFNNRTDALPKRPLEEAWVETFNKSSEGLSTFPAQACKIFSAHSQQDLEKPDINGLTTNSNQHSAEFLSTTVRTSEAPPEVANLPEFSVAAILPQLQLPSGFAFNSSKNHTSDPSESQLHPASSHIESPKIIFRNSQLKINDAMSLTTETPLTDGENNSDTNEFNKAVANATSLTNDLFLSSNVKADSSSLVIKTENLSNFIITDSQLVSNHETKTGKLTTSNWEVFKANEAYNENNQKKTTGVNFLLGFKKELEKKRTTEITKNLSETESQPNLLLKENGIEKQKTVEFKSNKKISQSDFNDTNNNVETSCIESKKCEKVQSFKENIKKLNSNKKNEVHKHRKIRSPDHYKEKNSYRSRDSHRKHKESRNDKDRCKKKKDNHRDERNRHKHSSHEEKSNHSKESRKTPSLAQPFIHKTSTSSSIISFLAPPSDFDSKDIAMYRAPSGLYYCTTCDYTSKHSSEFTDHLYSSLHKSKKKRKS